MTAGLGGLPRTASIRKATKWPPSSTGIGKRLRKPIAVEMTPISAMKLQEALRGGLAGDLRDAERPLQVVRADRAGQDAGEAVQRLADDRAPCARRRSQSAVQGAGVSVAGT